MTSYKAAKETINAYKNITSYFNESLSCTDMYNMLHFEMRFGEAETQVIIAALILSGAKFKREEGEK